MRQVTECHLYDLLSQFLTGRIQFPHLYKPLDKAIWQVLADAAVKQKYFTIERTFGDNNDFIYKFILGPDISCTLFQTQERSFYHYITTVYDNFDWRFVDDDYQTV